MIIGNMEWVGAKMEDFSNGVDERRENLHIAFEYL